MTFIEQVRAKRQKLADVLYDDEYSGIREIVEELYPDRAHFIYELLQNAEDAGATQASFSLATDGLLFDHDGRPFTEDDVWAITNIGKGSKKEQGDQIGRFGVGFKAVFAYCETPRISSPTFSFEISNLVLPSEIKDSPNPGKVTSFVFPFNSTKKVAAVAYKEIKAGLEELAETTLLFLSHLNCISWTIGKAQSGQVRRIQHTPDHIEIQKTTGATTRSHFLRFSEPVANLPKQRISVAYALDYLPNVNAFNPSNPLAAQLRVVPAAPGRVAVFFPAEKESSGLRLHIHAPFVPELSRASIKETPANEPLFEQLAALAATSLHAIRTLGLLNAEFLGVLPNSQDNLPPRYEPIRDAIIEAMNTQPLTPTHDKSHAPAKHLKQAKAALKELLSLEDIEYLIEYDEEPPHWAIAASQKNSNVDRFLSSLAITDWDTDDFLAAIKAKAVSNSFRKPDLAFLTWLKAKPLEWHQEMYSLVKRELAASDPVSGLTELQIVRLSNGDYSVGTQCYFSTPGVEHDKVFPRVAKGVYQSGKSKNLQEESRQFLALCGVRDVGEAEEVEAILRERYGATNFKPNIKDLLRWVALVEKDPSKARLFQPYFILQRDDDKWGQPASLFLDKPFLETGLSVYYDALRSSDGSAAGAAPRALAPNYEDCGVPLTKLIAFAKAVGVRTDLSSINDLLLLLPHIESGLKAGTPDVAAIALLWGRLCERGKKDAHLLDDSHTYHKGWGHYGTSYSPSPLCVRLRSLAWVPQKTPTGLAFLRPVQASRELLPSGFPVDSGWHWLQTLHFGENAQRASAEYKHRVELAKELGVEHKFVELLRALPAKEQEEMQNQFQEILEKRAAARRRLHTAGAEPVAFHEALAEAFTRPASREGQESAPTSGTSADPKRRRERTGAEIAAALEAEPSPESRVYFGVCRKWNGKDDAVRFALRTWYAGKCQICGETFTQRNGTPYFEGVYLVPYTRAEWLDRVGNVVCVCARHSAMLQFGPIEVDASILDQILAMKTAVEGGSPEQSCLCLTLCGEQVNLRYAEKHFIDLQEMIKASQKASGRA